jgi:pimeloyl-ACP methyl ester carboxylesterase
MIAVAPNIEKVGKDRELKALAEGATVSFALNGEDWSFEVRITGGDIAIRSVPRSTGQLGGDVDFELTAGDYQWSKLLDPIPEAGTQSVIHLIRVGKLVLNGERGKFDRHIHLVRSLVEVLRGTAAEDFVPHRQLSARGEYHRVESEIGTADVHIERCGVGQPVVAFATAGSTSSQWHGLMTETALTDRFEFITIDLPWHGMSSPTFGAELGSWSLTPDSYSQFIRDAVRTIGVTNPVLLGASMAGAAVVHAVANYPVDFSGAVSCQAGLSVGNRLAPQLTDTSIDQSLFVPEWTYGLMNPNSPAEFRKRVWWGYSSGGHGLYAADVDSYQQWDFNRVSKGLTSRSPHIAVLSGEYDTTVTPADSQKLAELIPNSSFQVMPELGHFPHAENPRVFAKYLEPALERILGIALEKLPQ